MISAGNAIDFVEQMKPDRAQVDAVYQRIALYVAPYARPHGLTHKGKEPLPPTDYLEKVSSQAANGMVAHLLPDSWHELEFQDEKLNDLDEGKAFLKDLSDAMFAQRARPASGFGEQMLSCVRSGFDFGVFPLRVFIENGNLAYHSPLPTEILLSADGRGAINGAARHFTMSAQAAVNQFGESQLDANIVAEAQKPKSTEKYDFYYLCRKMGNVWECVYVDKKHEKTLWHGEYRSSPMFVGRFDRQADSPYGRGVGEAARQKAETLSNVNNLLAKNAHYDLNPALLFRGEGSADAAPILRPGRVITGGVGIDGRPSLQRLNVNGDTVAGLNFKQAIEADIAALYFNDILTQSADISNATATAVAAMERSKYNMLSGLAHRLENELFAPLIRAEIEALQNEDKQRLAKGMSPRLPAMPQEVLEAYQKSGMPQIKISYKGRLKEADRLDVLGDTERLVGQTAQLAQLDPNVLQALDVRRVLVQIAENSRVDNTVIRNTDDIDRAQRQGAMQRSAEAEILAQAEALAQQQQGATDA